MHERKQTSAIIRQVNFHIFRLDLHNSRDFMDFLNVDTKFMGRSRYSQDF